MLETKQPETIQTIELSKPRRWAALAVLLFAQFGLAIDLTIMDIALPGISAELRPTSDQQLWMVDIYSLVIAGLLVSSSSLSDRIGRKKTFLAGALIFCIGSTLVLAANSALEVIGVRAVMGIAAALIMPTTIAAIRNIFLDPKERAIALAAWSIIGGSGMVVGPVMGGLLLEFFTWHSVFLVNVPLMGIILVFGTFVLPEIKIKKDGPWDLLAAVLSLAGMVLSMWGLKRMAANTGTIEASFVIALMVGILLLFIFVRRCLHSAEPLLDVRLFANKTFTAGILAAFGSMFAMAALLFLLSQWMQLANGYTPLEAGIRLIPMAIASIIAGAAAPRIAQKFGVKRSLAGGLAIAGVSLIAMYFFRENVTYPVVAVVTSLVGLGTGSLAVGSAALMCATPPEKASSGAAFEEVAYDLGNVLGVAMLGSVAAILYRTGIHANVLSESGIGAELASQATQSLAAAVSIAKQYAAEELLREAIASFNHSFILASLIGGVIMLIVAYIAYRLVPRDLDIMSE